MLKGWKTILFNLALVMAPPALTYLAGLNWEQYVSPYYASVIVGVLGIVLRVVTTTPVFKK